MVDIASKMEIEKNEKLISLVSLLESFQNEHARLKSTLADAHFLLSTAKHSKGHDQISQIQYDYRMKATATIEINSDLFILDRNRKKNSKKISTEQLAKPSLRKRIVKKDHNDENSHPLINRLDENVIIKSNKNPLINNNDIDKLSKDICEIDLLKNDKKNNECVSLDDDENEKELVNPIKWFGILTPPDLSLSQSKFEDGLQNMINLANMLNKLNNLSRELEE